MRTSKTKNPRRSFLLGLCACAAFLLAIPAQASAAAGWRVSDLSNTTVAPGDGDPATAEHRYLVGIENTNSATATNTPADPLVFKGTLPAGITLVSVEPFSAQHELDPSWQCTPVSPGDSSFECQNPSRFIGAYEIIWVFVRASVAADASGVLTASFSASGAGAAEASGTLDPTTISADPVGFGIDAFDVQASEGPSGTAFQRAGAHPYSLTTSIDFNTADGSIPGTGPYNPIEPPRDTVVDLPAGFVGNPTVVGSCTLGELSNTASGNPRPLCPSSSQVGTVGLLVKGEFGETDGTGSTPPPFPLFNVVAPPGAAARFGFSAFGNVVTFDATLRQGGDYRLTVGAHGIPEGLRVIGSDVTFWGVPGEESHTPERACPGERNPGPLGGPSCSAPSDQPFLRMPTSCTGKGLPWSLHIDSWLNPAGFDSTGYPELADPKWKSASILSHEAPGYPRSPVASDPSMRWGDELPLSGCEEVPVKGKLSATPTAIDTETSSGLGVKVEVPNPGLNSASGISSSDIKAVKVSLPQGLTINPSQAEGLGVCSPAQYDSTELSFQPTPGVGCPDDSKIGTVEVHTPLLEETIPGDVFIAKPYDNPFDSLLAIYIVLHEPQRGVLVKLPGEVRTNEVTGQIEAEFKDLPQLPFSDFEFNFRQGARAPLVTPPTCGKYTTEAVFTPWSDSSHTLTSKSSFEIVHGIGGAPCPPGGTPPFHPGFSAGSVNNNAGSYSPFDMRLTRNDGEQDMTRFSAVLPPGVIGNLTGVSKCSDSAIAVAKAKSGLEERANPSCPVSSQIGRSVVGAGVGSVLTYVPGKLYLGGPFHGDPLSVIAITPAVAGPFDVGTVVVHEALTLNPRTAEVEVDGSASDPIPHILKGIPAKLRDLRVYVDRDRFTLNPTSCDPSSARATLFGSAADVFSPTDDTPVALSDRYQAAGCASLGFEPRLTLKLKGGTKRGDHPGLTATYRPRSGDANASGVTVRLPHSAFLDQGHIRTICTRVQFAAKACPPGAQYGYIKAWTPLLEEPLEGPVYLRSSNHKLPDLVFDLHGPVDVEVASRLDSIHGGIRASVESIPDAPLSKVVLQMQGAKKGLIVNSRSLCGGTNRANVEFEGHNGKLSTVDPVLQPGCGKVLRSKRG